MTLLGVGMLTIAAVFSVSAAMPLSVRIYPTKSTEVCLNSVLVGFNLKPLSQALLRNALPGWSCYRCCDLISACACLHKEIDSFVGGCTTI